MSELDIHSRIQDLLSRYRLIKEERWLDQSVRSKKVISRYRSLLEKKKIENRENGNLFNPLHWFRLNETKHSELLGYLLKPDEQHGQGCLFLHSFLEELDVLEPKKGKWKVTIEQGRVDILLTRQQPASVIIIENKSNFATDQQHQLYRYWYENVHRQHGISFGDYKKDEVKRKFKVIYLPGGDEKEPEPHSLKCPQHLKIKDPKLPDTLPLKHETYYFRNTVASWLSNIINEVPEGNHRLRMYLTYYQEICQSM